jgi:hypothetical protein
VVVNALRTLAPGSSSAGAEAGDGAAAASCGDGEGDDEGSAAAAAADAGGTGSGPAAGAGAGEAGSRLRLLVAFTPAASQPYYEQLVLCAPRGRVRVALRGEGFAPRLALPAGVDVAGLDFGDVLVGDSR